MCVCVCVDGNEGNMSASATMWLIGVFLIVFDINGAVRNRGRRCCQAAATPLILQAGFVDSKTNVI